MKRFFFLSIIAGMSAVMMAQEPVGERPQRTPEVEATQQTTRLVRELGIKDSVRIDTIYRMHLKYARTRHQGMTRAENMQRLESIRDELKALLTPKEYERFMNHPIETPRRPHGASRMMPAMTAPSDSAHNRPPMPMKRR